MDGPNVNWNVLNILNDKLESKNFPETLNIGSCAPYTKIFLEDKQPT